MEIKNTLFKKIEDITDHKIKSLAEDRVSKFNEAIKKYNDPNTP